MYYVFKGEDFSMGLRHGAAYRLDIDIYKDLVWVTIHVGFFEGKIVCPYETITGFQKNWMRL